MKKLFVLSGAVFFFSGIAVNAQTSKVLIDNDQMKLTEYTSKPGESVCGEGRHTHGDHATILLTDAKVKTVQADNTTLIETYSAGKHSYSVLQDGKTTVMTTDGSFWAKAATHQVTNIGNNVMRFYIIETK